jgi:hypothetical protein
MRFDRFCRYAVYAGDADGYPPGVGFFRGKAMTTPGKSLFTSGDSRHFYELSPQRADSHFAHLSDRRQG